MGFIRVARLLEGEETLPGESRKQAESCRRRCRGILWGHPHLEGDGLAWLARLPIVALRLVVAIRCHRRSFRPLVPSAGGAGQGGNDLAGVRPSAGGE